MDLVERYLHAVKALLPRKAQDDILSELSENILCQMEEKEAELGRPLLEAEQEEVIKHHGHPVVVAARYGRSRYLIGPAVFPFYWLTLKIALASALIVRFIVAIATALVSADPTHQILPATLAVPYVVVPVFCWITGAFAAFEFCSSFLNLNLKTSWSPRSLPAIGKHLRPIPRTESVAQIIFGSAFILWWQAVPVAPFLIFGPAANVIAPGPVWTTLHWPILLVALAGVAQSWVNLVRPNLTKVRARIGLATQAASLAILCLALRAGNWVVVSSAVRDPGQYSGVVSVVNQIVSYCLLAGIVILGLQFAWECIKHFRHAPSCQKVHSFDALRRS